MNEHTQVEIMNIVLDVLMIVCIFFAGYSFVFIDGILETIYSAGSLTLGIILSQAKIVPSKKEVVKNDC